MRPRQVRYQAALRPDIKCFPNFKPLPRTALPTGAHFWCNRVKTVPKPHQFTLATSEPMRASMACRFGLNNASHFLCSFICEYFLNTFASHCRKRCVTHSSGYTARH
jgi:hypothetical protein